MLKKLENIKDKNEEQLQVIKDQRENQLKELKNIDKNKMLKAINEINKKNAKANKLVLEFKKIDKVFKNVELVCTKTGGTKYGFNRFFLPLKFIAKIHNYEITLDKAIQDQTKFKILINKVNEYNPRNAKKVKKKERVLESARKLLDVRKHIIDLFEKGTFPYKGNVFKTKEKEELEEESEELEENKFFKHIENESKSINDDLYKHILVI